jgi:hypothetical protein
MIEDKTNPDGTQKYKQLTKELDNLIGTVILQEPKEVKLTTKPIVIRPNSKLGKLMGLGDKPITINQDKALRTLKSGLSFGVMGWKATSAAFNGALITITNAMHLTKGIVGKIVGVNPDDWDADLGKSALGWKDYAGYLKDTMTGNAHNNKLWLMAKEFNWMPDNYDYDTGAPDLTYDTTRPTLNSYAFMFHNMVESYGALTHLAVLSRSVKLTNATGEKFSIYDAYDVKDGKLVWTKGSRGKKLGANGIQEDLNELDFREVKSLKRANERMHGSYRKEEQVAISATVWGEFLLQFKKFFYTFLKGLYGSPYNDITVGKYVLNKNISRPDGVPVWEWENEVMQGRLRVLSASMMAMVSKKHRDVLALADDKTKLSRKKRIAELINTGMWMAMMYAIFYGLLAGDDDDKETYLDFRLRRLLLEDSSMGLLPVDLLNTIQKPVVVLDRVAAVGNAFWDMSAATITGKRTRSGNIPGVKTIANITPILSNAKQIRELLNDARLDTDYIFGILPVDGNSTFIPLFEEGTSR